MSNNKFFNVYFPYCLKKQENGKYRVFNGLNVPIGFHTWDSGQEERLRELALDECKRVPKRQMSVQLDRSAIEVSLTFIKRWLKKLHCEHTEIYLYSLAFGCHPLDSQGNMRECMCKLETLLRMWKPFDRSNPVQYVKELNCFFHGYFPYCLVRQANGSYVVCNREYKPVGFNTWNYVDYDQYHVAMPLVITQEQAKQISCKDADTTAKWFDEGRVYLYDVISNPLRKETNMLRYLAILEILARDF